MNIKNTLFTIGFSLLFTAKIFGGIGIEDLHGIMPDPNVICINTVTMPSTITTLSQHSTLWGTQTTCNNGMAVYGTLYYNVTITPKAATTPQLPLYARSFSILKNEYIYSDGGGSGLSQIGVNNLLHQANFGGIFTLTWSAND